jgi:hypothetical protein
MSSSDSSEWRFLKAFFAKMPSMAKTGTPVETRGYGEPVFVSFSENFLKETPFQTAP